jgi:hypothetical protein
VQNFGRYPRRENADPFLYVIARSTCDEAIHTFFAARWIASLTLAMTVAESGLLFEIESRLRRDDKWNYPSSTASAPLTASALSITVRSSEPACTEMFSAKNRASVT